MAILSKGLISETGRSYLGKCGLRPFFIDVAGKLTGEPAGSPVSVITRGKLNLAMQESLTSGVSNVLELLPCLMVWVVAMEDNRVLFGGVMGGPVLIAGESGARERLEAHLVSKGLAPAVAAEYSVSVPMWSRERVPEAAEHLSSVFYQVSGWQPLLMQENRIRALQKRQIADAIEDQKKRGEQVLYAFEKERALLANIRAGERNEARRVLNEMLAAIYLSSPQMGVLRARTVELMSCLTRAAIEDNPLMEPLIRRNHVWTEKLIKARSFEDLSQDLMAALDEFIDGVYLHGANRANAKVRAALDYLSRNYERKITLAEVARSVGLSPFRVAHLVKKFTGRTVLQNLFEIRIRHAQHMLERTGRNCAEIAYESGFGDQSYFIKHFKRIVGVTPAKYRKFAPVG